jgi:triosephosphate isomerase
MVNTRTPLIAGNWKLNLDHLQAIAFVQKLAWSLSDAKHDPSTVEVAVFPPFTDIRSVQTLVAADKLPIAYGAQDVSEHESGAYTGEISATFLRALECGYVIVGHSERRTLHNETDEQIAGKVAAAVQQNVVPVICVGETSEDLEKHGPSAVRSRRTAEGRPVEDLVDRRHRRGLRARVGYRFRPGGHARAGGERCRSSARGHPRDAG